MLSSCICGVGGFNNRNEKECHRQSCPKAKPHCYILRLDSNKEPKLLITVPRSEDGRFKVCHLIADISDLSEAWPCTSCSTAMLHISEVGRHIKNVIKRMVYKPELKTSGCDAEWQNPSANKLWNHDQSTAPISLVLIYTIDSYPHLFMQQPTSKHYHAARP